MRVCYCPMNGGTMDTYGSQGDQIKFSQMPGDFLYPADMTSYEMELPFLWPGAWLHTARADIDFLAMGRISYVLYSVLQSANGVSSTNATITCYAWAEDVELAGLTSGLVMQSDEYESSGSISGPASTVASIAGKLKNFPVIGSFARATEMGASAVKGIASIFGYSNPPVIDDVMPYMPKAFHSFASVETSVPMDKLVVDPKNEITIDKSTLGISRDDELIITHFCGRKSWITGSLWTEAYAPGTQLLAFPVTPRMFSSIAGTSQSFINSTPAAHAAAMFNNWRGSMIYSIKFVKSRYHTGRVQISWDPNGTPGTNAETTTMTRIVDLQTETEVEFSIPYKAHSPWLSTDNTANTWANTTGGTINPYNTDSYNGVVRVTVLNELTGPAASQSIDILLFARCGDDFKLSVPTTLPRTYSAFQVQSLELTDAASTTPDLHTTAMTVGEDVVSLRQILHRASYWHTAPLGDPLTDGTNWKTRNLYSNTNYIPRFPLDPGFYTNALNIATAPVLNAPRRYQYSPNHPINWLGNCFVGYRGGLVHHFNVLDQGTQLASSVKVEHDPRIWVLDNGFQANNRYSNTLDNGTASTLSRALVTTQSTGPLRGAWGQRGLAMTNTNTQSAVSVVSPQYSRYKFRSSYAPNRELINGTQYEYDSLRISADVFAGAQSGATTTNPGWPLVEIYVAGAVDFDLIYFVCVPTYYDIATPNAVDNFLYIP